MNQELKNWSNGTVIYTADIDATEDTAFSVRAGLAVMHAIKNKVKLTWADLRDCNLRDCNLRGADLSECNLLNTDLSGADLSWADLRNADLSWADLHGANLSGADLRGADLRGADLRGADLRGANLSWADLRKADLSWADLHGADLVFLKTDIWECYITTDNISIGRHSYMATEWFSFDDDKISQMHKDAITWWQKWKPIIQAIHADLVKESEKK